MADDTYNNQAIYHKQEGDELVVADGGTVTTESGGTHTMETGGKIALESGSELEVQSGGFFDLQTGADLRLTSASNDLSAAQLRALLWNQVQFSVITESQAGVSEVLSTVNLPSAGYIIISTGISCNDCSAWLTSTAGIPGQVMYITLRGGLGSITSCLISTSGVSIVGTLSGDVSSIILHGSANSRGWVKMLLTDTSEWSIVEKAEISCIEQGA